MQRHRSKKKQYNREKEKEKKRKRKEGEWQPLLTSECSSYYPRSSRSTYIRA